MRGFKLLSEKNERCRFDIRALIHVPLGMGRISNSAKIPRRMHWNTLCHLMCVRPGSIFWTWDFNLKLPGVLLTQGHGWLFRKMHWFFFWFRLRCSGDRPIKSSRIPLEIRKRCSRVFRFFQRSGSIHQQKTLLYCPRNRKYFVQIELGWVNLGTYFSETCISNGCVEWSDNETQNWNEHSTLVGTASIGARNSFEENAIDSV